MLSTKFIVMIETENILEKQAENLQQDFQNNKEISGTAKEQYQIFQHVRDYDHNFNFLEPEIIHRSANIFVTRRLEAFYSKKSNDSNNRYQEINEMCLLLIR